MSGFRHRRRLRATAIVAIAGMLFHAALLLLHQPAFGAAGPQGGGTIALCTPVGLKLVPLADLPSPDDAPDPSDHTKITYCPVCLGAQLAGACLPPPVAQLPFPSFDTQTAITARSDTGPLRVLISALFPRAPPLIV